MMGSMRLPEKIRIVRNNFRNWLTLILMLKFGKGNKLPVVTRSGLRYFLWRNQVIVLFLHLWKGIPGDEAINYIIRDRIHYRDKNPVIHGWIGNGNKNNGNILDVFFNEEYRFLNVRDRVVIDVGASIGDSAIYFALNGASKVIGLEPYPYSFKFGIRNVKENGLEDRILLLNAAYGHDGEILVDDSFESKDTTQLKHYDKGKKIRVYSLKTLLDEFGGERTVLKMDCEGCEYFLLEEPENVFSHIEMMQIEYHYGYQKLVNKLESMGFIVKFTEPEKNQNPHAENPNMEVGYIYARRGQAPENLDNEVLGRR